MRAGDELHFEVADATEILERTPQVLRAFLSGLSDGWLTATEGPDTWSPYDIVGHLIHGEEADWIGRARMILEHGETRTFEPFDSRTSRRSASSSSRRRSSHCAVVTRNSVP